MSEIEQIKCRIKENTQKIELFELTENDYSRITVNNLKNENIKLKRLLNLKRR